MSELSAFKLGLIGAQNPASTLPVSLLNLEDGDEVLDLASGNGIKTAQLASLGTKVTSVELKAKKIERAEANLKRLGLSATHIVHDLKTAPAVKAFKAVLLDAPCSGTGTLRGHPEIRLRLTPEDVSRLSSLQSSMLESAWQVTESGGKLVYAICALTSQESTDVVTRFLTEHSNAELIDFDLPVAHLKTLEGCFVLPFDGLDGFFIAQFLKL